MGETRAFGFEIGQWAAVRWLLVGTEAAIMAFDYLLPLVDLKQDQRCEVDTDSDQHRFWATVLALYAGFGLVLIPLFIATVSGIARRE